MRNPKRKLACLLSAVVLLATAPVLSAVRRADASIDPHLQWQMRKAGAGQELPVFVHGTGIDAAVRAARAGGLRVVDTFRLVGVAVAVGTAEEIAGVSKARGVTHLEGDRIISWHLDTSHQATRGDTARAGFSVGSDSVPGVDGSGVSIAVVDSGIDGTHPMFASGAGSRVVRNVKLTCFYLVSCTGALGNSKDALYQDAPGNDSDTISAGGHGTHVAGIAAGGAYTSKDDLALIGAAPGAKVVGISVGHVISVYGGTAGLNWVLEHHAAPCGTGVSATVCPPIKVVNNSWGSPGDFNTSSVHAKVLNALIGAGVTVVYSAGNDGGDGTSNLTNASGASPTPGVIMVANYNDEGTGSRDRNLSSSSSRGLAGKPITYPDISAPGSAITSACRPTLAVCDPRPEDPDTGTIGGTSMAAPHVAGIVAQVVQAYRLRFGSDPSPDYIENLLEDTAYKFVAGATYEADPQNSDNTTSFDKGHGLVDAKGALAAMHELDLGESQPVQPAPLVCTAGGVLLEDPKRDTYIVAFLPDDPNQTDIPPYEPSLDVRSARADWDGSGAMTFSVTVEDLGEALPATTPSVAYNVNFNHASKRYYVDAARDANGGVRFSWGIWNNLEATQVRTHLGTITGSFDASNDTVSFVLGNANLAAAGVAVFADGTVLDGISASARHGVATDATTAGLTYDTGDSACRFILGVGVQPPATPPPPPAPEATLDDTNGTYSWTAGPFTRQATGLALLLGDPCGAPDDEKCDNHRIQVNVPSAGGVLSVKLSSTDPNADFDLYVWNPDGTELGFSERGGTNNEDVTRPVTQSGVYTVSVVAYSAANSSYTGTATFTPSNASPSPSPSTSPSPDPSPSQYDAALEPGDPAHAWTGTPPVQVNQTFTCAGVATNICHNRRLWLKGFGASGATFTVSISTNAPDHYDLGLYIYNPAGVQVASWTAGGSNHTLVVPVLAKGIYRVAVTGNLAPGVSFSATASLA